MYDSPPPKKKKGISDYNKFYGTFMFTRHDILLSIITITTIEFQVYLFIYNIDNSFLNRNKIKKRLN